ncbi:hypothetical protein [Nocardiopsis dassonvillei]|uniref:hypothetical protein n=1 Tax=Nocardiopsis dassonvillei TaxID=2014 RepID=UPI00363288A9
MRVTPGRVAPTALPVTGDGFSRGLLKQVLRRGEDGTVVRRAGVMGVVLTSGTVEPGMPVRVRVPRGAHTPLERV